MPPISRTQIPTPDPTPLPTAQDFFLNIPLYKTFDITEENADNVKGVEQFAGSLDAYCVECKQASVFRQRFIIGGTPYPSQAGNRSASVPQPPSAPVSKTGSFVLEHIFNVILFCSRNSAHSITFIFRINNRTITKIGQYPSMADFHLPAIHKYRKILGDQKYKEFSSGVGLFLTM